MPFTRSTSARRAGALAALGLLGVSLTFAAARPAHAWGEEGHAYVAHVAVGSLPDPLKAFYAQNRAWFEEKSSYPDRWRNRPDKAEAPRHFLDTENFGHGTDVSKLPRSFAEAVKLRGYEKLREDGVNPWTVRRHYQLLVDAFREKRWEDAMIESAYLSHYVGDAHVPFHASSNYDGQLSTPPQKGVHSRFESQMVERTLKADDLKPGEPEKIADPLEATFAALQDSVNQVPAILQADRDAAKEAGIDLATATRDSFRDKDAYWNAFAAKTRPVAAGRLEKGGRTLAGYLVRAWEEAGKPALPASGFTMTDRLLPLAPPTDRRRDDKTPVVPPVPEEAKHAARGRATVISVPSKKLGQRLPVTILLPKDYETSGLRYPVLYLLHGATDNHAAWNAKSGIAAYTADLPLIVVMPDAHGDSFYTNSSVRGDVNGYLLEDLIPAIDERYRTLGTAAGRAIAGLSMGGYGAWRTALDAPDRFAAAASLSGALFWGEGDPTANAGLKRFIEGVHGADAGKVKELYAQDRLLSRIEKLTDAKNGYRGPALYFDCGSEDFLIQSNRQMETDLLERAVPYEFSEFDGAHTWTYWDEHVQDVLRFVQRHLAPAAK